MGYVDLIYDTNPDFTVKNQLFYDNIDSFKDSFLPYGERQWIKTVEDKITVTKKVPSEWLPDWMSVNALSSINYRKTAGYIRSGGVAGTTTISVRMCCSMAAARCSTLRTRCSGRSSPIRAMRLVTR